MSNFITSLFKAIKNLNEMIEIQGYDISNTKEISVHEVENMYRSNNLNTLYKKMEGIGSLYVFYTLDTNLREGGLEEILDHVYIDEHFIDNDDTLIIVTKNDLNDTMHETIRKKQKFEWIKNNRLIILLSLPRLQVNILHHEMVPKHVIITSEKDIFDVKTRFNISDDSEFPEISRFDPVAQSIFMKPGQICRIERKSKTAIRSNYYRLCLNI